MFKNTDEKVETYATAASGIVVTQMPSFKNAEGENYYPNRTEYFHPDSGMVNGTWDANNGSDIEAAIAEFYTYVFGYAPTGDNVYLYNLYGAKYFGKDTYHTGVDMYSTGNDKVRSYHYGKIVYMDKDGYGAIGIYCPNLKVTVYYLHMNLDYCEASLGETIHAGTVIGKESNIGVDSKHLHFEVHMGCQPDGPAGLPTINQDLKTISPYDYM